MSFLRFLNPDNYSRKAKTWKKSRDDDVLSVLSWNIHRDKLDECLRVSIDGMMAFLINTRHKWYHTKQEDWEDLKKKTIDLIKGGQGVTREKRALETDKRNLTGEIDTLKSQFADMKYQMDKLCAKSDKKIGENKHEEFTTVNKNIDADIDKKISNTTHEANHATASGTDGIFSLQHSLIVDKNQIEQLA